MKVVMLSTWSRYIKGVTTPQRSIFWRIEWECRICPAVRDCPPEEQAQREADAKEEALVYDMLTAAAEWYHLQLQNYPDIVDHLHNHYGFSPEIVEELKIGFAPPGTSDPDITSDLAEHLGAIPDFKDNLVKSGLFTFGITGWSALGLFQGTDHLSILEKRQSGQHDRQGHTNHPG